jgi:hypothetical protein
MTWLRACLPVVALASLGPLLLAAAPAAKKSPREALQAFNDLIGSWKGTGAPEGNQAAKQRGFWSEKITWTWQFKGDDAWLNVVFDKSKHFTSGQMRSVPATDLYQLSLATPDKSKLDFTGGMKEHVLTLEREEAATKEKQRLVFTFLHSNRFLYRYEVKGPERPLFNRLYQVGATKEGEPFAGPSDGRPECVVSGGLGKIPVTYKGETYYVCCSGCRDAFKESPDKYIKEYKERKAKEAKEGSR